MKNLQRGSKITYKREIRFKGFENVTAKVVAIHGNFALLDNGDEVLIK